MPQTAFVARLRRLIKAFDPPFLPPGFVTLTCYKRSRVPASYTLSIGDRDVSFDRDGRRNGQGSDLPGGWIVMNRERSGTSGRKLAEKIRRRGD